MDGDNLLSKTDNYVNTVITTIVSLIWGCPFWRLIFELPYQKKHQDLECTYQIAILRLSYLADRKKVLKKARYRLFQILHSKYLKMFKFKQKIYLVCKEYNNNSYIRCFIKWIAVKLSLILGHRIIGWRFWNHNWIYDKECDTFAWM